MKAQLLGQMSPSSWNFPWRRHLAVSALLNLLFCLCYCTSCHVGLEGCALNSLHCCTSLGARITPYVPPYLLKEHPDASLPAGTQQVYEPYFTGGELGCEHSRLTHSHHFIICFQVLYSAARQVTLGWCDRLLG